MATLNQEIMKSGLKKSFIALKARIHPTELSHILSGRRKTNVYAKKEEAIRKVLKKFGRAA